MPQRKKITNQENIAAVLEILGDCPDVRLPAKAKRSEDGQVDYDDADVFIGYSNKKGSAADRKRRARRAR